MVVEYYDQKFTKDGRPRARRQKLGGHKEYQFPRSLLRPKPLACMGLMIMWWFRHRISTYFEIKEQDKFLQKIKIAPYGVLGTSLTMQGSIKKEAGLPDEDIVITDPAGLHHIHTLADGAGGAAGAIYNWLGLKGAFPEDVRRAVTTVCDAKYHEYNGHKVIHVVGPDFREGKWTEREATLELSRAYRNLLHEFVLSEGKTLRMLPVSGGIFSGKLYDQIPPLTQEAVVLAFEQLHRFDKEELLRDDRNIELCVFMNREWDMYKNVFKYVVPPQQL